MSENIPENPLERLIDNIKSLAPAQEEVPHSRTNGAYIPQKRYKKGAGGNAAQNKGLVVFCLEGGSYIPITAALGKNYTGLIGRDTEVLEDVGLTITLRFEWPGYPPECFQVRTLDWQTPPKKFTLGKLATEVSEAVRKFVEKMEGQTIDAQHESWMIGPGGIRLEHLRLGALEQVSAGSWQPRLFYSP